MSEQAVVMIVIAVMITTTILGVTFMRTWGKRVDRSGSRSLGDPELLRKLERLENAVDSIAVEVERISEGQRFTTRLLAEKTGDALPENRT